MIIILSVPGSEEVGSRRWQVLLVSDESSSGSSMCSGVGRCGSGQRTKMKILIFLSCLCNGLAITVHYETKNSFNKNIKENRDSLKDIRLVVPNQSRTLQKPILVSREDANESKPLTGARGDAKANRAVPRLKSRTDKRKPIIDRVGTAKQNVLIDQNHQNYMQKVANQLFMAQKHASVLSDYQKFILNQDPNVKSLVLGQSVQERNSKSFKQERAVSSTPKYEPVTGALQTLVVVTPKVPTPSRKRHQSSNDHSAQAAHVKYVALAPQSVSHFVETQAPSPKVSLLSYHDPQPYMYYNLAVTGKPHVEAAQTSSTQRLNLGSFESPHYYKEDSGHEDSPHHGGTEYDFMYKVKDHEKHNDFGHKESRSGKITYGYYYVHLPDGRLETVKYWADKTGYHAKVDYQGEAKHPLHSEHKLHSHNFVHP